MDSVEHWRKIKDLPGYEISDKGNLRNDKGKLLKPFTTENGYKRFHFSKFGNRSYYIHRLVAAAFLPNPNNEPQINHIDGDKTNNALANLEWCSASRNTKLAFQNGRKASNGKKRAIVEIKVIREFSSIAEAADYCGINRNTLNQSLRGRQKTAGGRLFRYAEDVL